jgi:tetratricopeptide (TPR) repeat protein
MADLADQEKADFEAALACYKAGEPARAAELFAAVLRRAPDHADTLRLHGLALVRSGRAAAGLPSLARARRLRRPDPLTHLHYGIGLLESGRPVRAAAALRRATVLAPKNPTAWINLSTAILALGKPQAARAAARRALALAPNAGEAHYALGLAQRSANNLSGALSAFAEAVRLRPDLADAWIDFGQARLQLGRVGAAAHAMQQALLARPGYAAAEANLAGLELLQGAQEEALDRLRKLLAREPGCVPARLNLANALLLDREAEDALAVLEGPAPPGREGAHWRAHRAMALLVLRRFAQAEAELDATPQPVGDAEILIAWRRLVLAEHAGDLETAAQLAERLDALAREEGASLLDHRIITHFDLAAFRNKRKEPERAFEHWTAGHRLLSRAQQFSRESFHEFVDANIASFNQTRLSAGAFSRNSDAVPVFIAGLPRSGTSLVEQILSAHADVHGAGERSALHQTIVEVAGPFHQAATVARLAGLDEPTLTAAASKYVEELRALAPTSRYVVDKMPVNALHLGFLSTLLPAARVILCRRDHRDIGLSIFQLRFFGYHPFAHDLADLGWYMGEHERLVSHWRKAIPVRWLEVALSDWVEDFSSTLSRVLDFLDLPHDSACERFHEQQRRVRTASAEQVRQPVNARGLGRWRQYETELDPMLLELRSAGLID